MPPHLPSPRVPDSLDAPPLRWGVLGTGWIAGTFVAALRASTRQVVQAVGSRSPDSARRAAIAFGAASAHGSYEALVADPEVDIVYVATPHHLHLQHALLAIEAGKHVLVEKPVGLDAAEARVIGEAACRAGVFCMEAMWTLFLPRYDIVRQLLADSVVGEPKVVQADMGSRSRTPTASCAPSSPVARCSTWAPIRSPLPRGCSGHRTRWSPSVPLRRTASTAS